MSFSIVLVIMLATGLFGGMINWVLPANLDSSGNRIQPVVHCILIGIGATILIPLFLEIAQSKLLDKMHNSYTLSDTTVIASTPVTKTVKKTEKLMDGKDSVSNPKKDTVQKDSPVKEKTKNKPVDPSVKHVEPKTVVSGKSENEGEHPPLKDYLIFGAYCFLAAVAGPRFINNLLDGVLKDKQIATLAKDKKVATEEKEKAIEEKEKVIEEKEQVEKVKTKLTAQNQLAAENDEKVALEMVDNTVVKTKGVDAVAPVNRIVPGPIIHDDDPQKGRFGGKSENNGRVLKAEVKKSSIPEFYHVKIWVESTDAAKPLEDVMFYIHDSFRPSVYPITKNEFVDGKAVDDDILSYGAFTVGVITDNGETLLELDLSEQPEFPKTFRER